MATTAGVDPSLCHDSLPFDDTFHIVVEKDGRVVQIEIFREVELRYVQRVLCNTFNERFPLMCAILSDSEGHIFDDFNDKPFEHARPNDVFNVEFELTRDMFWFDWADRKGDGSRDAPLNVCEVPPLSLE